MADGRGTTARSARAEGLTRARRKTQTRRRAPRPDPDRTGAERRSRSRRRRLRVPAWALPLLVLAAVGFLYVRPISSYLETRDQLADRRSEVATLRAERARVAARLERATSLEELSRAARKIGYVRPEEHLFIVKGTAAWARRHAG